MAFAPTPPSPLAPPLYTIFMKKACKRLLELYVFLCVSCQFFRVFVFVFYIFQLFNFCLTNLRSVQLCIFKARLTKIEKLNDIKKNTKTRENWQETHKKTYSFSKHLNPFFMNMVAEKLWSQ